MPHRGNLTDAERRMTTDPVAFLANNVVIVRSPNGAKRLGAQYWQLQPAATGDFETSTADIAHRKNRKGAAMPVYNLRQADEGAIHAYYLHWMENDVVQITLGGAADFFITATMNGCSLSHAVVEGTTFVAHHNDKDGSGRASEIEAQDIAHRDTARYFHQAAYRKTRGVFKKVVDSRYFATVLGVRLGDAWSFCSASRKLYSGTSKWSHKGVKSVV